MANYEYQGLDRSGNQISGSVEAETEKLAKQKLRKSDIYVTRIKLKGSSKKTQKKLTSAERALNPDKTKIKLTDLANMTRQLATLVKANVPLVEALSAIQEQIEDEKFKDVVSRVKNRVNEGVALAKAMGDFPKIFSNLYTSMIRAGEASGALHIVLNRLADFIERNLRLRNKLVSSMAYPIILGVVSLIIVSGLLTFVVPKLTEMFQGQGKALPTLTIILIGISDLLKDYWHFIFVTIIFCIFIFKKYVSTPGGKRWLDEKLISLPLFGIALKKIAISRFSRTLSTLLSSGVPLIAALDIVKAVVNNVVIGESIEEVKKGVKEGKSIAKNLRLSGHFPPVVIHMIAIGEKSGGKELEEMLGNVADAYDNEVEDALVKLTSVIEPLMIIILGAFVGFVVLAIISPIMEMTRID